MESNSPLGCVRSLVITRHDDIINFAWVRPSAPHPCPLSPDGGEGTEMNELTPSPPLGERVAEATAVAEAG